MGARSVRRDGICGHAGRCGYLGAGDRCPTPHITEHEESTGWQVRTVIMPCTVTLATQSESIINVILARGVSQDEAETLGRWHRGDCPGRGGTSRR